MNIFKSFIFISVFCFLTFNTSGQGFILSQRNNIPVLLKNDTLVNAWAGGINSSTISTFDFNKDNIQDIVLFDRQHNRSLVFILNSGNPIFSPEFSEILPELSRYAIFYDYDLDGKKDLFTSATSGIKVFRNITLGSDVSFKSIREGLLTKYFSSFVNMDISTMDVPAFCDPDNDGDMDILHFKASQGTSLDLEKNMSKETFGKPDSLLFKNLDNCWGGFMESSCKSYNFGYDCKNNFRLEHAGGGAVLALNIDNDLDLDVILGKEDCDNIVYLENKGTAINAVFTKLNLSYPAPVPGSLPFPLPFFEDMDGDNIKDLTITLGMPFPVDTVNQSKNILYYKNQGTNTLPNFSYQSDAFIQNTMIDLGRNASPTFIDLDGDGDLDMLVSNSASGKNAASIFSFLNTGSLSNPVFTLSDTNYLSLQAQGYDEIKIAVADLNNDNKKDLILNYLLENNLQVRWCENQSASGFSPSTFKVLNLPMQSSSSLLFQDIDNDGFTDVLAGNSDGDLNYFKHNKDISSPGFLLSNSNFGGISSNNNSTNGNLSLGIADINRDAKPDLLTINDLGIFRLYPSFKEQDQNNFMGSDIYNSTQIVSSLGKRLCISITELNNDNTSEIFIGNQNGGIMLFQIQSITEGLSVNTENIQETPFSIFPNPTAGNFTIKTSEDLNITVTDISGITVLNSIVTSQMQFEIKNLQKGIYFVFSQNGSGKRHTQKLVIN